MNRSTHVAPITALQARNTGLGEAAAPREPRLQASVKKVATILDYSERFVRELCNRGELETNDRAGRGLRIYLDSVAAYQQRNRSVP